MSVPFSIMSNTVSPGLRTSFVCLVGGVNGGVSYRQIIGIHSYKPKSVNMHAEWLGTCSQRT